MLARAGAPGPHRGGAVDAVATVIACNGTGRLNGQPREAGVRADAGRAGLSAIVVRSARRLPDLEPDVGRRAAPDPPLHAVPEDAHEGVFELSLIHISEPTRLGMISYAVFCLKKKK